MAEKKNPVITIEMTNGDIIKAELYPDVAPNTVNNFLSLVNKGFYNGLIFHRVIKGFMIQGGCPDGNGMGGPGYCIKGEFSHNGFQNDLAHTEGVLSMARAMNPNSAGSQFFIMHKDAPYLNGEYAAFGQVIDGMDIVNKIAEVRTDYSDRPMKEQKIKSITAETFAANSTTTSFPSMSAKISRPRVGRFTNRRPERLPMCGRPIPTIRSSRSTMRSL